MFVYFVRHAEAEDDAGSDFERRLTPKGLGQSDKIGGFCARCGLLPDLILTSPVVRAEQTARVVSKKLGGVEVAVVRWIACGMSPEVCADELGSYTRFDSLMLVGHEPDFGETVAFFLGLPDPGSLKIRKGSLTALELGTLRRGSGQLQFSVPVRLM